MLGFGSVQLPARPAIREISTDPQMSGGSGRNRGKFCSGNRVGLYRRLMSHIGIEIGGTKIQIVAGDADGHFLERHRLAADRARGGAGIREQIASVIPGLMDRHRIASVGVGFGGPVDPKTGQICCSHQVPGWHEFVNSPECPLLWRTMPMWPPWERHCAEQGEGLSASSGSTWAAVWAVAWS